LPLFGKPKIKDIGWPEKVRIFVGIDLKMSYLGGAMYIPVES
jgi:hypothetical protein